MPCYKCMAMDLRSGYDIDVISNVMKECKQRLPKTIIFRLFYINICKRKHVCYICKKCGISLDDWLSGVFVHVHQCHHSIDNKYMFSKYDGLKMPCGSTEFWDTAGKYYSKLSIQCRFKDVFTVIPHVILMSIRFDVLQNLHLFTMCKYISSIIDKKHEYFSYFINNLCSQNEDSVRCIFCMAYYDSFPSTDICIAHVEKCCGLDT